MYFLIVVAVAGLGNIARRLLRCAGLWRGRHELRYFLPDFGRILVLLLVMAVLFRKPHGFAPKIHA